MILHRYLDERGADVIENLRVKVSNPGTFNDPFEFLMAIKPSQDSALVRKMFKNKYLKGDGFDRIYRVMKENGFKGTKQDCREVAKNNLTSKEKLNGIFETLAPGLRETLERNKEKTSKSLRILCFSKPRKVTPEGEILMWAHYTNRHRGMRYHFNTNEFPVLSNNFFPVNYSKTRTSLDVIDFLKNADEEIKKVLNINLRTKSIAWAYEEEYRWLISPQECSINSDQHEFLNIKPVAIKQIDLGINVDSELEERVLSHVSDKEELHHIKITKAQTDNTEYKIYYKTLLERKKPYISSASKPYRAEPLNHFLHNFLSR